MKESFNRGRGPDRRRAWPTKVKAVLYPFLLLFLALLCAFSIWAEWGPYAWIAAAQIALQGGYGGSTNLVVTVFLFLVIGGLVTKWLGPAVAAAARGAVIIAAALVLAHLFLGVYFIALRDNAPARVSFTDAAQNVTWLPRTMAID